MIEWQQRAKAQTAMGACGRIPGNGDTKEKTEAPSFNSASRFHQANLEP
jgi:hypothetical protein